MKQSSLTNQSKKFVGEIQIDYLPGSIPQTRVTSSDEAYAILKPLFKRIQYKEEVYAIYMNTTLNNLGWAKISEGGVRGSVVDIKIVLQHALMCHSHSLIIAHNHPSGSPNPSKEDIHFTNKLSKACKIMDLVLLDSMIITQKGYYSFVNEGLIDISSK